MSHLNKYYNTNVILKFILVLFTILLNFSFQYNTIDPVFYSKSLSFCLLLILLSLYSLRKEVSISTTTFIQFLLIIVIVSINAYKAYIPSHFISKSIPILLFFLSIKLITSLLRSNSIKPLFLIKTLLFIVFIHAVIGFIQYFNLGLRELPPYELFPNSVLINKNLFASYIVLNIPLVLYLNNRFLKVFLILFLSLIVIISGSRAGFIGLLMVSSLLLMVTKKNKLVIICTLLLLVTLTVVLFSNHFSMISTKITELLDLFTINESSKKLPNSLKERIVLWQCTLSMIKENIISGVGIGNWEFMIWKYNPKNIISNYQNVAILRPHNQILKILSENGIIIFSILLYSFYDLLKKSYHLDRKILFIILLTILLFTFVDFPLESLSHLFLISIIISLILYTDKKSKPINLNNQVKNRFLSIQLILLLFITSFLFFKKNSAIHYKRATSLFMQNKYNSSLTELSKVDKYTYNIDPLLNHVNQLNAMNYTKLKNDSLALKYLIKSEKIMHYFPYYRYNLGMAYLNVGDFKNAKRHIDYAQEKIPNFKLMKKLN